MSQRNLLILIAAAAVSLACYAGGQQNPFARYVAHGLAGIESEALERVPNEELYNSAMEAMVDVLHKRGDEHSEFIPRDDADPFRAEMRQQFGGIGVRIRFTGEPPQLTIVGAPDPGTPAARARVRSGDRVLEIDGKSTVGLTMSDVLHAMRGDPGQSIRLTILHAGEDRPETLELVREVITVDSILGDRRTAQGGWEFRVERDPRIAQIRVMAFGNKTVDELIRVLARLTEAGVEAVVLDLRDDAGGSLDAAIAISNMFLPDGLPIVEIRGRDGELHDRYMTNGSGLYLQLPLVVLVNQNSASASEIVAACLQDHGRAAVGGQRSFGKGTVQRLIPVESGRSLLKLTAASYWRPSEKNIHRRADASESDDWGVRPDAELDLPLEKEEYEAFLKHRIDRDLWGSTPDQTAASVTEATPTDRDSGPQPPFVDRQLERAIDHLQEMLSH